MTPKMTEIFEKVPSATSRSNFGGPAGGSALERVSPASKKHYMTRMPFLSSRVIQRQGKLDSNRRVKNWCKWVTKMKIAQNL